MKRDLNGQKMLLWLDSLARDGNFTIWNSEKRQVEYVHKIGLEGFRKSEVRMEVGEKEITMAEKIYRSLEETGWNKAQSAKSFNISIKVFNRLLEKYHIEKDKKAIKAFQEKEKMNLLYALENTSWDYEETGKMLGVSAKTVRRRIKIYRFKN